MDIGLTFPRQVRLTRCAIIYPGIEFRAANDADKQQLAKYGYDVTPYVQKIDIYESLWDNTISGSVTLLENIALSEYLPIVGVEVFLVSFVIDTYMAGEPREFTRAFRIVKLHDQVFPRNDVRFYVLELVTHEFINSVSSRICRVFQNMTAASAVLDILRNDLDVGVAQLTEFEDTFGNINVMIPNYNPLRAINYFTLLAQTKKQPHESNFVFYETLDGFHFTSIYSLIQAARDADPTTLKTFDVNPGQSVQPRTPDTQLLDNIIKIQQDQSFDLLFDIGSGMLRSRMVHFDFLARKFDHEQDSRYTDTFKETTHLDDFPVYPNNYDLSVAKDTRLFAVPSNIWTANSAYIATQGETLIEQSLHESIILRNRQMREIQHLQTLIDLPGQPDLRAGAVVNVNYPSARSLQENQNINTPMLNDISPYYSGKHLVTAVHHILRSKSPGSMEYRMHIKVCRDSFGAPLIGTGDTTGA